VSPHRPIEAGIAWLTDTGGVMRVTDFQQATGSSVSVDAPFCRASAQWQVS
jgi:hypothetical protein